MELAHDQIEALIPHRRPFLFVKSAKCVSQTEIHAVASWDADNPILGGHFPGLPVVPGVLIAEAAAQIAGVLISFNSEKALEEKHAQTSKEKQLGMLIGVRRASFHKPVFPGDRLHFVVMLGNAIGGMVSASAEASDDSGHKAFKGEISVAVVEKSKLPMAGNQVLPA